MCIRPTQSFVIWIMLRTKQCAFVFWMVVEAVLWFMVEILMMDNLEIKSGMCHEWYNRK